MQIVTTVPLAMVAGGGGGLPWRYTPIALSPADALSNKYLKANSYHLLLVLFKSILKFATCWRSIAPINRPIAPQQPESQPNYLKWILAEKLENKMTIICNY